MKGRFMIENPGEIEATLKLTMSIKQWEELREQLDKKWPASMLSTSITDLLCQARKVFYPSPGEDDDK